MISEDKIPHEKKRYACPRENFCFLLTLQPAVSVSYRGMAGQIVIGPAQFHMFGVNRNS